MAKTKSIGGIQIGTSFLVLIFVVLALVIFSVLSVISSLSDNRLTEKNLASVMNYYQADSLAEETLVAISQEISSAGGSFSVEAAGRLGVAYDIQSGIISYDVKISDSLKLFVDVKAQQTPDVSGKNYMILRWQEENVADYEIDESLPVWTGEE